HVAEHYGFLSSYLRYGPGKLSLAEQDQYFDEVALIAEALGATQVPRSRPAVERYLQGMQPELVYDERTAEVMLLLLAAPTPNWMTKPAGYLVTQAAVDLLPDWAQAMAGLKQSWPKQQGIRSGMRWLPKVHRSSRRNGASQRAKRRLSVVSQQSQKHSTLPPTFVALCNTPSKALQYMPQSHRLFWRKNHGKRDS